MVSRVLIAALALGWAGASQAQAVDWRQAGGELFARTPITPENAEVVGPSTDVEPRIPALRQPYGDVVAVAAERYGLDPKLLHAVVAVESSYRPNAISPAGAGGLTQLMPATAIAMGVRDRFDPSDNLLGGAAFLAQQMVRFGDLRLALAAYNAGPARVAALGHVPSIPETRAYVGSVINCYLALTVGRGVRSAKDCRAEGVSP